MGRIAAHSRQYPAKNSTRSKLLARTDGTTIVCVAAGTSLKSEPDLPPNDLAGSVDHKRITSNIASANGPHTDLDRFIFGSLSYFAVNSEQPPYMEAVHFAYSVSV
jgi:hypothetical protein